MDASTARQCEATTKTGRPCRNPAMTGSAFCFWHDPELSEKRREARSKGGRARHGRKLDASLCEPVEINSLADVVSLVTEEINAIRSTCEPSISRGRGIGYLAGILVNVYQASEIEQRIAALEARSGL